MAVVVEAEPWFVVTLVISNMLGTTSVTTTFVAGAVPRFVTRTVKVTVWLARA